MRRESETTNFNNSMTRHTEYQPANKPRVYNFTPDFSIRSVSQIDLSLLKENGIRTLFVDVDGTLVSPNKETITDESLAFLHRAREKGLDVFVASNSTRDLSFITSNTGVSAIRTGLRKKPLPIFFNKLLKESGASPKESAIIDDKLIHGILGGNIMGMTTIWTESLGLGWKNYATGIAFVEKLARNRLRNME